MSNSPFPPVGIPWQTFATQILQRGIWQSLLHIEWCRHAAQAEIFPLSRLTTEQKSCPTTALLIFLYFLTFSFYALAFYSTHAHIFCLQSTLEIVDTAILFCSSLSCAWWWFIFSMLTSLFKICFTWFHVFLFHFYSPLTSEKVCRFQI